jgi:FkbM family methyltransferase
MQTVALRNDYFAGKLTKQAYIDAIFKCHTVLMEYPEFIRGTNIQKLEITDGQLIATTRDRGIRLLCNAQDKRLIPFETINFHGYEQKEIEIILKLVRCSASSAIYDIGANIGYISLCIAKTLPDIQVVSFEPIPCTFDQLCANIKLNHIRTIRPLNHGLSNETGPVEFFFYPEGSGNASLQQLVAVESLTKVKTYVKTLDSVVEELGVPPDFIKCDVEGAELLVFQGARRTLETAQPIVYTEMLRKWAAKFHYHPNDIIDYFCDIHYGCFVIHGGKLMSFETVTETTEETNYVFLHKQKHASLIDLISH